jgi:diketogulonate reductase-like aldo/keto reductase
MAEDTTAHESSKMPATQSRITLNNGVDLPALGFGVFQTPPDVTQAAVEEALRVGYRMVDTAASYLNEPEVGAAIAASGIERAELFLQTKVWVSDYGYDKALHAFDASTRKLGVDYIDLYLLHQPLPQAFDATVDAYRALEHLLEEGRVRAIGISNFSPAHLETVLPRLSVVPAVNQIEVHPYYSQPALCAVHKQRGIATQAWSPLGDDVPVHERIRSRRNLALDDARSSEEIGILGQEDAQGRQAGCGQSVALQHPARPAGVAGRRTRPPDHGAFHEVIGAHGESPRGRPPIAVGAAQVSPFDRRPADIRSP